MSEIIKQSMSNIWASTGDIVAPDSVKIADGWLVEVVPRQYWNWMQNRTDTNLAYLFQHGIPEWDATVEYIANKSYVIHADAVYKAILTGTNQNPTTATTYWKVAFATSTTALEALKETTPAADKLPYFNSATTAATTTITPLARTLLDDTTQGEMLTTVGAQPVDATLTALAGVTTSTNKLPYFSGVDTATVTDLSAFGRSLIDDVDAASARSTLNVYSTLEVDSGLALKQPLDTTLTALAGLATANNTIAYFTATDVATTTTLTPFARSLLDDVDATAARTTIGLNNVDNTSDANKPVSTAQQTALNLKAPLASPAFTGTPLAPTASVGTSTTQVATTAFVNAEINADRPYSVTTTDIKMDGVQSLGVLATLPRADHVHPSDTSKLSLSGGTMSGQITFNSNSLVVGNAGGTSRGQLYNDAGGIGFVSTLGQWAARVPQGTNDWAITGTCTAGAFTGPLNGSATTLTGLTSSVAELNYVAGVTSSIQTQLDGKAPLASPTFTGTPTAPTATAGTNTTQIATTAFVQAAAGGIGVGQTWTNVTASRALSTTYTNSTGKPIQVVVCTTNANSQNLALTVGGVIVMSCISGGSSSTGGWVTAIIPNGVSYSATSSSAIVRWTELR